MKLIYLVDEKLIELKETPNGDDFEFSLTLLNTELKKRLLDIREYFNANEIATDIHIYIHPHNRYQIIVRKDFYHDFLLQLFKQQLLLELKWGE
jgi:hypothetical protein